ncbi:hypothetical protein Pmar_PMAR027220 [Perkinsus marinus ATCC 50983]|uniref:Uncharacterized protein n=1 Tax=Perkinsus marinus (strain ATCC 50983 / TXsc) TaxID=423536 RepID=C5LWV8_PERM5|nr:hypothetical protein Pmar_PMAR027220 [Perkinsus marinus ATCC 50983]EEQ98736.1 hypothetical protein Pmar_PMAR027220 [Perkinsus marinus ATCC 50983]|eukprot:XP_002766019.1 hypothetical protein Pmar_PMAR027220 [Perkinsus marinus ATCC 50983]
MNHIDGIIRFVKDDSEVVSVANIGLVKVSGFLQESLQEANASIRVNNDGRVLAYGFDRPGKCIELTERWDKERVVQQRTRVLVPQPNVVSKVAETELSVLANLIAPPSEGGEGQRFTLRLFEDVDDATPMDNVEAADDEVHEEPETITAAVATESYRGALKDLEDDLEEAIGGSNSAVSGEEEEDLLDLL